MRIKVTNAGMLVLDIGARLDLITDKGFAHGVAPTAKLEFRANGIYSHEIWNVLNAAVGMDLDELDFKLPEDDEDSQAAALAELMWYYLRKSGYPLIPQIKTAAVGHALTLKWIHIVKSPAVYQVWWNGEHYKDVNSVDWDPNGPDKLNPRTQPSKWHPMWAHCLDLVDPVAGKSLKMWDWWGDRWHVTREEDIEDDTIH